MGKPWNRRCCGVPNMLPHDPSCEYIKTLLCDAVPICEASREWGLGVSRVQYADGLQDVYGHALVTDPHDFIPDEECATPEQRENWKAARAKCECGR